MELASNQKCKRILLYTESADISTTEEVVLFLTVFTVLLTVESNVSIVTYV